MTGNKKCRCLHLVVKSEYWLERLFPITHAILVCATWRPHIKVLVAAPVFTHWFAFVFNVLFFKKVTGCQKKVFLLMDGCLLDSGTEQHVSSQKQVLHRESDILKIVAFWQRSEKGPNKSQFFVWRKKINSHAQK